jgi:hypothetical protein
MLSLNRPRSRRLSALAPGTSSHERVDQPTAGVALGFAYPEVGLVSQLATVRQSLAAARTPKMARIRGIDFMGRVALSYE